MKITIAKDSAYGNVLYRPICDNAKAFARIAGTTTLTHKTLEEINSMGIEIVWDTDRTLTFTTKANKSHAIEQDNGSFKCSACGSTDLHNHLSDKFICNVCDIVLS